MEGKRLYREGWLTKLGSSIKNWKRRWFILKEDTLSYYRVRGDSTPAGVINLSLATVRRIKDTKKANLFEIITPTRIYQIYADHPEALNDWLNYINTAINKYYNLNVAK
jgi:hypothetical protein